MVTEIGATSDQRERILVTAFSRKAIDKRSSREIYEFQKFFIGNYIQEVYNDQDYNTKQ